MTNKVYCAKSIGFHFDIKNSSIRITEFNIEKETAKQYQLSCKSRNVKSYMRLNKYYIGSSDSIGNFYALSPEEAVANLKASLQEKKDKVLREIELIDNLLNYEPVIG